MYNLNSLALIRHTALISLDTDKYFVTRSPKPGYRGTKINMNSLISTRNGLKLLKYPEVVVFLIMIFVLGSLWGFVESYLFVFLKDLHAPNYLLGKLNWKSNFKLNRWMIVRYFVI